MSLPSSSPPLLQETKDWINTQRDYKGSFSRADPMRYEPQGPGPRARKEAAELLSLAAALPAPPPPQMHLHTTQRDTYVPVDIPPAQERGKRVMKNLDGGPAHRDAIFLAEAGLLSRADADRMVGAGAGATGGEMGTLAGTMLVTTG
jgi:hypothetical protein